MATIDWARVARRFVVMSVVVWALTLLFAWLLHLGDPDDPRIRDDVTIVAFLVGITWLLGAILASPLIPSTGRVGPAEAPREGRAWPSGVRLPTGVRMSRVAERFVPPSWTRAAPLFLVAVEMLTATALLDRS